jgi:sulfonate transport system permease protein
MKLPLAAPAATDASVRAATLLVAIGAWVVATLFVSPIILPAPSATWDVLVQLVGTGQLLSAWALSLAELAVASAVGAAGGIALGLALGRFRAADRFFEPVLTALFLTPRIALLPLVALWFGFGPRGQVVLILLFCFFEVFFTVRDGVKRTDAQLVEVARSYCVPDRMLFRHVLLPASLPYVVTGLRLGILHGMVGMVLAGFFLESSGIGGMLYEEASSFRTAGLMAGLATVAALGVAASVGLRRLERAFAPWQGEAFQP